MTALEVLCGIGALVIVALAYLVGRLQGDVRRLTGQVERLESTPPQVVTEAVAAAPIATPVVVAVEAPSSQVDDNPGGDEVPVITAISEVDDLDITRARVASVTLARPLIKVAAFSFGVRRALGDEQRFRVRYAMHQELKRQRKMRRRRKAGRAPSRGWQA